MRRNRKAFRSKMASERSPGSVQTSRETADATDFRDTLENLSHIRSRTFATQETPSIQVACHGVCQIRWRQRKQRAQVAGGYHLRIRKDMLRIQRGDVME